MMRNYPLILIIVFLIWLIPQATLAEVRITEGTPLVLTFEDTNPSPSIRAIRKNNSVYLNLPFLYEYLNIVATRNIRNGEIFLKFGKASFKLYPNDPAYYLDGKRIPLAVAPFEAEDQFWLPLEFLLKLGLTVERNGDGVLALDWDQNYLLSMENIVYQNFPVVVLIGSGKLEAIAAPDQPDQSEGFCFELANTVKHFTLDEALKNNASVTGIRVEPDQTNLKVSFQLKPNFVGHLISDPKQPNRLLVVFTETGAMVTPLPQDIESKMTIPNLNLEPVLKAAQIPKGLLAGKVIILDPGHGGEDFGACGRQGFLEKDNNLEIALRLQELLEQAGASVLLTRPGDVYISLYERSYYANDLGADLFISIHTNNHPDLSVHGVEVYSFPGRSVAKTLAQSVLNQFGQTTGFKKLGAKVENFVVIRETQMPSILVEVGFLSNYQEEQTMRTQEFKDEAALGVFLGVSDFFK